MDCSLMHEYLIDYHFAVAEGERRRAMEEHLIGCTACLRAYLDLKRAIETPPDLPAASPASPGRLALSDERQDDRPGEAARLRLRAEVARTFVVPRRAPHGHLARFLSRPIPLYQAAAAFLLLIGAGLLPPMLRARPGATRPLFASSGEMVDTSRQRAASLNLY
jgi:hypothetical protein